MLDTLQNKDWTKVQGRLRVELGDDIYASWFARMDLEGIETGTARLSVPTRFLKSWIGSHYVGQVLACVQSVHSDVRRLDIIVRSAIVRSIGPHQNGHASEGPAALVAASQETPPEGSPLDPRLTLGTFAVGRSNTLAHAAAVQVASWKKDEKAMFNPLFIHGGAGLGKTHLLQAVVSAGNAGGERKFLYLTAEKFMYGFVVALRVRVRLAFKEALRGVDVLVIDDVQCLRRKSIYAEFCHTLNVLIDGGQRVIIAADRPPSELEEFDDPLRARLAAGLVVEMGPLGEELRFEILKARIAVHKAAYPSFEVPAAVISHIVKTFARNGRDLEGASNRLLAHNRLTGHAVTLELAERECRDLIRPHESKRIKMEDIQRVVARQYNVTRMDLISSGRTAQVVRPRQIAMYLAKVLTLRSLPEIGRRFGGRDHTTVIHAVRKIAMLVGDKTVYQCPVAEGPVEIDKNLAEEIEILKRQLQE